MFNSLVMQNIKPEEEEFVEEHREENAVVHKRPLQVPSVRLLSQCHPVQAALRQVELLEGKNAELLLDR